MTSAPAQSTSTFRRRRIPRKRSSSTSSSSSGYQQDDLAAHTRLGGISSETIKSQSPNGGSGPSLLTLPMEIIVHHLMPQLNYPTLLALRLAHPRYYHSPLMYPSRITAITMRFSWLLERYNRSEQKAMPQLSGHVDCATDSGFLANQHIQRMLREERSTRPASWLSRGWGMMRDRAARVSRRQRVREALLAMHRTGLLFMLAVAVAAIVVTVLTGSSGGLIDMLSTGADRIQHLMT